MKFITLHWTAGNYTPTVSEKSRYHFLIGGNGTVYSGRFKPEANIPNPQTGYLVDGMYAAHCGGGNSYNIGISICGMQGYRTPRNPGHYPVTRVSFETMCKLAASLSGQYRIPVDAGHIFTHMEFGIRNRKSSSYGKIDICYLPWEPGLNPAEVGEYIRGKVEWYLRR